MSNVLAKFALESVQDYYETGHKDDVAFLTSATITLNAVKGEPFGPYTPFGRIQMGILNSAAAAVFVKVWQKHVAAMQEASRTGGQVHWPSHPEFYVTFKLDDGTGSE
jgi:hypothetical protein